MRGSRQVRRMRLAHNVSKHSIADAVLYGALLTIDAMATPTAPSAS